MILNNFIAILLQLAYCLANYSMSQNQDIPPLQIQHQSTKQEEVIIQNEDQNRNKQQRMDALHHQPSEQTNNFEAIFQYRIQKALQSKNEGNQEFKARDYQKAKDCYQRALGFLQPDTFYGASQQKCLKMAELSANLLFNVASCFFNEGRWKQAELLFNQAIVVNPKYVKAIYKRALSRYQLGEYNDAMLDIKEAFSLDKSNKQIYESYQKILIKYNEQVRKHRQKSKEMNSKIFTSSQQKIKDEEDEGQKKVQKQQNEQNKQEKGTWWLVLIPLVPLAAIGIYQGIKFLRS